MPVALQRQLEFLERETASWQPHKPTNMRHWDVEVWVAFAMHLYRHIAAVDAAWSEDNSTLDLVPTTKAEPAEEIGRLYQCWCDAVAPALQKVREAEQAGPPVALAVEFREALLTAKGKAAWNVPRLEQADRQLDAGGGRTLDEVMDELRRRSLGRGG